MHIYHSSIRDAGGPWTHGALVLIITLTITSRAFAGMTDGVKKVVLPNHLTVLLLENHKAPVANFNVFYKVGSRNERFGRTGLSHLVEHLMFRGTKKLKPEEFSNIIQRNGGSDNAFTTADFTAYFELINKDHIDVPIGLEADRMANFAPQGFDSEKAVVIEERRLRTEDNPQDALFEMAQAQAYVAHPYHWPVIGWMHDVQQLTLQDALDYHSIYYSPQNAIIVAVGDFDSAKVLKQISEAFGGIKNGSKPLPVTEVEPPQQGERHLELHRPAELPVIAEAFHTPNYTDPDAYALEVAATILAGGKSARLYKSLVVDKRMVVSVDASYDMQSFDPSLFWILSQVRPGVKPADVIAATDAEVARLANGQLGDEELQKAKNQEQADFVYGQDSIFQQGSMLAQYEMLGDYHMLDQYIPRIDKVTAADVQRVIKRYLVQTNRTLGVVVPTGVVPHPSGAGPGGPIRHWLQPPTGGVL